MTHESEADRKRRILEDMPTLARLTADAGLQKKYKDALVLLDEIGFDAIMRELCDVNLGEPLAAQEGAVIARAFTEEQRTGFNKARRIVRRFLDFDSVMEDAPNAPDYGADEVLRRFGYDPSTVADKED